MKSLIVRPEAEQDLVEGRDWYERQRQGLGLEFLNEVDEVFDRIRKSPGLYAVAYRGVRPARLDRFPYVTYFRILDDVIEVIAVQQGSRHARRWQSRA